ncbi:5989_t:CDS:2 [Ambispora gerdemannii]|uniref:5989_t:CDS:1 n=1 Tax=Ambispora gerdemannii TaxID=144530 RepID=A0A9N8UZF5_9GLOM|nr:5989_t:CDS:2 [Ambispora gerdemannii]
MCSVSVLLFVFTLLCTILIFNNAAQPKKYRCHVCRCYNKRSWTAPSTYDWQIPSLAAYDDNGHYFYDYYYNHYPKPPISNDYYDTAWLPIDASDEILPASSNLNSFPDLDENQNNISRDDENEKQAHAYNGNTITSPPPATSNTTITIQAMITVPLNATNDTNVASTVSQTPQKKQITPLLNYLDANMNLTGTSLPQNHNDPSISTGTLVATTILSTTIGLCRWAPNSNIFLYQHYKRPNTLLNQESLGFCLGISAQLIKMSTMILAPSRIWTVITWNIVSNSQNKFIEKPLSMVS